MGQVKQQLIEETSTKASSWNSPLAKALNFDPEAEKTKIEVLTRTKAIRDQAMKHFSDFATQFSITRFMVDGKFWMSKAKALGYTFTETADVYHWINEDTGDVMTETGLHCRCNETTEAVFIGPTKHAMVEFYKK